MAGSVPATARTTIPQAESDKAQPPLISKSLPILSSIPPVFVLVKVCLLLFWIPVSLGG